MRNKSALMKSQSGQIMAYTIIIIMLAGLIIAPLLRFTYGSWHSIKIREERTLELYASDAGIEDALYQIKTEKEGTGVGNLTFGGDPYLAGTPDMNNRDVNVSVEKVWLPEDLPGNSETEAPVPGSTDKSDELVVVGMLKTVQATAAADDFTSLSGGTGNWTTGSWAVTGSASLGSGTEGCGSGNCLKFADAAGSAQREARLLKYMKPQLKFTARASSLEPGDNVNLSVKYGGSNWETVQSWVDGTETPTCNAYNFNLYDLYGWFGDSTPGPLLFRFEANLNSSVVASHDFESPANTWSGGSGWSSNWTNSAGSGNPTGETAILTGNDGNGNPPQGTYYLRLRSSSGYAQRRLNLSGYTNPHLQFWAKATSFEGSENAQFLTRVGNSGAFTEQLRWRDGGSYPSWPAERKDDNVYHFFDLDLSQFGGGGQSNFWIAFDASMGDTNDYFFIDDIRVVEGDSFYVDNLWVGDEYNSNTIEIAYTDVTMGDMYLDRIGVWMPPGCTYVGVVGNETTVELEKEPTTTLTDIYSGGTILEWDYGNVALHLPCCQLPIVKTLTFVYVVDITQSVEGMFTWIAADRVNNGPPSATDTQDDYISWDKGYEIYKAISTATSDIFGSNTQVTAYVAQGELNKRNAVSYGDYVATGNPLLIDYAGSTAVKEKVIDPTNSGTWVTKSGFYYDGRAEIPSVGSLPDDAEVISAWLYWSAFIEDYNPAVRTTDWESFGSQPDTVVDFMYPKRYGSETFSVAAGNGSESYTTLAYTNSVEPYKESIDLLAGEPILTLSPIRYWSENLGMAVNGNGDDSFLTAHRPISLAPAPRVWVNSVLRTEGTDYVINYPSGNVTITGDTLSGAVVIDYSVDGPLMLIKGTDYTINQIVVGAETRYTGFTVINDNLVGTVTVNSYWAKHWQLNLQHAAYDRYGTVLAPMVEEIVPPSGHVGYSYACFRDVTNLLEAAAGSSGKHPGKGQYAVGNIKSTPGVDSSAWDTRSFSGWSLIVVYRSETETAHQFYLYDPIHNNDRDGTLEDGECPFQVRPTTDYSPQPSYIYVPFTLTDFYPPEGTVDGRVTYFVGEGDTTYTGDAIGFKGVAQPSYTTLSGPNNPANDVMNTASTTGEKGIDIDTYDIMSEVGSDHAANVRLQTDGDRWYLVYMILSFKTDLLPKADYAFDVASVTYQFELGSQ